MGKELPKGWVETNLSEVFDVRDGTHDSPKYIENGFPLVTSKNLRTGILNFDKIKYISEFDFIEINKRSKVDIGDLLFSMIGTIGSSVIIKEEPLFAIKNIALFKPQTDISSRLLQLYLRTPFVVKKMESEAKGSTQKFVGLGYLRQFPFLIPPLPEQQRIVAKLDTLFGHLESLKTRLDKIPQLLKNFRQAILTQAVTGKLTEEWREGKELDNYKKEWLIRIRESEGEKANNSLVNSGRKKQKLQDFMWHEYNEIGWAQLSVESAAIFIIDCLHSTPKFVPNGEYVVDTTCILPFNIIWGQARKVDEEYFKKWIIRLEPTEGDILFSREGTIGVAVKVPKNKRLCIGQRMMMFRFASFIKPEFAEIYINSMVFRDEYLPHIKGVAAQHLNIGDIRKLNFPVPSKLEQTEIVKRVESLLAKADAIEAKYDRLKTKIDNLPQAILAKAFKGELVAQLPTDGDARELLEEIKRLKAEADKKPKKKLGRKNRN